MGKTLDSAASCMASDGIGQHRVDALHPCRARHGLHFEDVRKLLEVLYRLVEQENSVVVIVHNLDVIKTADHVPDLGPGGGVRGGEVIAQGTPEEVAAVPESYTGQYLRPMLERQREAAE